MNKKIIIFSVIIIAFLMGIFSYPLVPDRMASHWNEQGLVNGYVSKGVGLFFFPILILIISLFLLLIPKIDPLKKNIEKFQEEYDLFVVWFTVFFFYIYALTLLWNMGATFSMTLVLMPAFAALFYFMAILLEKAKRNYFIGIRTPWTLASDEVWNKTHKLGAKLFKIVALFTLISVFFTQFSFYFVFIPLIVFSLYLVFYSYSEFKREEK
ncbi:MAG: SdpI family protein [Candidatus Paceibacterota bacterium]|nr:SdpI family protein [Candidatus Paceibacterota bacterium]MDD5555475.1 SdpI family protein [Candidatus Paceibacterota bacterium]